MDWNKAELEGELERYRACLEERDLAPASVESLVGYGRRFVRWLYAEFNARGAASRPDPISPRRRLSIQELRHEVDAYVDYLAAAGRSKGGIPTYERQALSFLHFLETGDCRGS